MRNIKVNNLILIVLSIFLISGAMTLMVACGGDDNAGSVRSEDTMLTLTKPVTSWIGVWKIVTEDGRPPAANGYNSLILTLTADTFTSEYNSDVASCTWSGTHTSSPTTLTITTDTATGPPCDQAVGKTRTAQLTLGNNLTLDWTAETMGTLQVYQRAS